MKLLIIYIIGCVLLVFGLVWWIGQDSSSLSQGSLDLAETSFEFGEISLAQGKVNHSVGIKNNSQEPVSINKIYTSCMCTSARLLNSENEVLGSFGMPGHGLSNKTNVVVEPGQEFLLEAVFDPTVHGLAGLGLNSRKIYLETNSQSVPRLELAFQAVVVE